MQKIVLLFVCLFIVGIGAVSYAEEKGKESQKYVIISEKDGEITVSFSERHKKAVSMEETMDELAKDLEDLAKDLEEINHKYGCPMKSTVESIKVGMSADDAKKWILNNHPKIGGSVTEEHMIVVWWKNPHNSKEALYLYVYLNSGEVSGVQFKKLDENGQVINHGPCKH